MNSEEAGIREEIFKKVKELYSLKNTKKKIEPGKDRIPYAGRVYDEKEMVSLVDASLDFWLTSGRYANRFEKEFSSFLQVENTLLTNSGSSANLLAISALTSPKLKNKRLKSGDEVVTLAASFPTTINPIIQNGLIPVFLDVDLNTANVDCSVLESAITDKTKAIFFAHTLGNPFDLDRVMKIARKYNLYVVEDACDALGAKYDNKYVGTFGDIGTFSFYPAHHITMGEGGALVTNDLQLRKLIESFRDWGRDCCCGPGCDNSCGRRFGWQLGELPFGYDHKYIYSHIGYNLKLTDMQAAVGVEQLKKLPGFIEARKKNFERLYNGLEKYKKYFILPQATPKSEPSWFGFLISIRENVGFDRGELINCLEKNKISTRLLFAGNILKQPAYDDIKYRRVDTLENTDYIMNNSFFIGVYPGLSEKMIDYVVGVFDEFIKNKAKRLI